ncbi:hypothetical protein Taro_021232 [Colocasia esculenta]|uniref:Uncharacterized protein n=1 Tax=Colocasia esculenta TaxID=4460 RepID=A0A843UYF1_COLES|nr:hypothetical protein [Colocasia esculenta]
MWRSSWWLESRRSSIPSSSSSPFRLLQPVQTVLLESTTVWMFSVCSLKRVRSRGRISSPLCRDAAG